MVKFPKNVRVWCMGHFDNKCNYIGGSEKVVSILNEDYESLRYLINHELPSSWMSSFYELYYIKKTWTGSKKRHIVSSNADLLKLCKDKSDPVIYIEHPESGEALVQLPPPEEEDYIPSLDFPPTTEPEPEGLESIQRYAAADWLGDNSLLDELGSVPLTDTGTSSSQPWGDVPLPYTAISSSQPCGSVPPPYTTVSSSTDWGSRWQPQIESHRHSSYTHYAFDLNQLPDADAYRHSSFTAGEFYSLDQPDSHRHSSYAPTNHPQIVQEDLDPDDEEDPDYEEEEESDDDEAEEMNEAETARFTIAEMAASVREGGGLRRLFELINAGDEEEADPGPPPDADDIYNWILPVIPLDPAASFESIDFNPRDVPRDVGRGAVFNTKKELQIAVGFWCLKQGREAKTIKSDTKRVWYKCKHSDNCTFKIRGKPDEDHLFWSIYSFVEDHSCSREVGNVFSIGAHADAVGAWVCGKIHENVDFIRPKAIRLEIRAEFGIEVSYGIALRARNLAIEMVYGSHDASYQLLPSYLHKLRERNPGSKVWLEVDDDDRFRQCFIAFGTTIAAYALGSLRPVVVIDGTHLKGKGKGVLFIAATKDANEQLFPLAFGVGPKENDESWGWFLSKFVNAFGNAAPLLVVSDQHISIANAVRLEMEHATHAYCYFHIAKNLRQYKDGVRERFTRAAYAYEQAVVDAELTRLKDRRESAWIKLMEIGIEKWSRAYCPIRRYSFMTSNVAESFNSRLRWARHLPICSLLESMRIVIDEWMTQKREAAANSDDQLSRVAHDRIAKDERTARKHLVMKRHEFIYSVTDKHSTHTVDLYGGTCGCGVFQIEEFPCSHALAAIIKAGRSIYQHVAPYYRREALLDVYSGTINGLPPRSQWQTPEGIEDIVVLPPIVTRQAGRPRGSRTKAHGEKARNQPQEGPSGVKKPRAPKRCSICRGTKHSRRKCPLNKE